MARQDSIEAKLTSVREELLGSFDAKLERLRDDLCNALEEKMQKLFGDLGGRRSSPQDTENMFNQRMEEDDDWGGDVDPQRFRDREIQLKKPSFYENLVALDISMEGVIPIAIRESSKEALKNGINVEDEGQPPLLANLSNEEAVVGPSRGIQMTLHPNTARQKGPTNVTSQASVGSSIALAHATRESKRSRTRRSHDIKKGPALRLPYDQPMTRAPKVGIKSQRHRTRQKRDVGKGQEALPVAAHTGRPLSTRIPVS